MAKNKFLDFSHFKGDLFGGLTAGIVALPLALAFGVQSGLGAEAGLFGAIFIGFFASLFGGTSTQISGPTAPMTAVSMLIIAGIIQANNGNVSLALPSILAVFFIAGLFQVLFGVFKLGGLIKFIPHPVVSGFMTGIGVIILITQLLPLFGYNPTQDITNIEKFTPQAEEILLEKILANESNGELLVLEDVKNSIIKAEAITPEQVTLEAKTLVSKNASGVVGSLRYVSKAIQNINWLELILALSTIFIIYGFKWITKVIPSTLVALLVVSIGAILAGFNFVSIGNIPSGFPSVNWKLFSNFNFSQVSPYILTSFSLALLGSIDSLLTSVVADNMTKTRHQSDKELIGQGVGNAVASIFGGIPGAGATIRTVVNINAGGKTKISGMIAALVLLIILLLLGPFASQIPKAVLAGILITVGIGVIDYKGIRALKNMPKIDAFVLITVLLMTVFWDLIYAVGIGLIISSLGFIKKMADITVESSSVQPYNNLSDNPEFSTIMNNQVVVKEINGPLFFGNTRDFKMLAEQIPIGISILVINMNNVPYMDQSGLMALEEVLIRLAQEKKKILITGLAEQPKYMLQSVEIIPVLVPENQIFKTFADCKIYLSQLVDEKID